MDGESITVEESADPRNDEVQGDMEKIEEGRPSFLERSLVRASLRRRKSHRIPSREYGTFENTAFVTDDLGPVDMVDAAFPEDEGPSLQETTALKIPRTQRKLTRWDRIQLEWRTFRLKVKDVFSIFEVSQRIQCFGGGVFAYFNFVCWLGKLNFLMSLFYLGALILPYALVTNPSLFNETVPVNVTSDWATALNCSYSYIENLKSYIDARASIQQTAIDILQGTGVMESAPFIFIGSYFDKIFWQSSKNPEVRYDASLAFYLCLWVTLGLSLIVTIFVSGQRILKRVNVQEDKSRFTFKVLARWDFNIQDRKRAKVEKRNIDRELDSSLREEERLLRKNKMSTTEKRVLFLKRFAVWCSYLILLAGCLTAIYFANVTALDKSDADTSFSMADFLQLFFQYLPSLVIVVANLLVATYCSRIVTVEEYDANIEILVTIWRTVILRFASLVVLMASIFDLLQSCFVKADARSCFGNSKRCSKAPCWETYVGQQFYKLVVLDFFVFVLVIFMDLFKKLVGKKIKFIGKPEFDIANNVLDLIYSQTLCWLGMFFSPLLPIVTFVKVVLLYIVRKLLVVHHIYEHRAKSANAAQTDSYFLDILLFSLIFVTILPLAVATSLFMPSSGCGPYRVARDVKGDKNSIQSRAVVNLPGGAQNVYSIIDSLIVMAPLWILLTFFVYYYYALSQAREKLKRVLMEQMTLEMKDLVFCRNQVKSAIRGVQLARRAQTS